MRDEQGNPDSILARSRRNADVPTTLMSSLGSTTGYLESSNVSDKKRYGHQPEKEVICATIHVQSHIFNSTVFYLLADQICDELADLSSQQVYK